MERQTFTGGDIRCARRVHGLTMLELGRRCGLSEAYISLLEQGKRPLTRLVADRLRRAFVSAGAEHD